MEAAQPALSGSGSSSGNGEDRGLFKDRWQDLVPERGMGIVRTECRGIGVGSCPDGNGIAVK